MKNYTPQQLRLRADAIDAYNAGKPVEMMDEYGAWFEPHGGPDCWIDIDTPVRPKPEPKTRPWSKPEDVPGPVCWLRTIGDVGHHLIVKIGINGVCVCGYRGPMEGLRGKAQSALLEEWEELKHREYSTDRKTWKACEVVEP